MAIQEVENHMIFYQGIYLNRECWNSVSLYRRCWMMMLVAILRISRVEFRAALKMYFKRRVFWVRCAFRFRDEKSDMRLYILCFPVNRNPLTTQCAPRPLCARPVILLFQSITILPHVSLTAP